MSSLITADIHFSYPEDVYRFEIVPWMVRFIKKKKIDNVFILGDLTKAKNRHDAKLVNLVSSSLCQIADVAKWVCIIKGNHDYIDPGIPFFGFVRDLKPNITFFNFPSMQSVSLGNIPRKVLFLPSTKEFDEDWRGIDWDEPEYIFAHQTFTGCVSENGTRLDSDDGFKKYEKKMIRGKRLIKIISGDIHKSQTLHKGKLIYVGAPYHVRFGDQFNPRLLYVDNKGKFHNVRYKTKSKLILEMQDGIQMNSFPVPSKKGDQVRFRMMVDDYDITKWTSYKNDVLKLCKAEGWEFSGFELVGHLSESSEKDTSLKRSDLEIFDSFCSKQKISSLTKKLGKELLEKHNELRTN